MLARRGALRLPVLDALYAGGVHSMDQWVGRLVRFLRQEGVYEDSLIIVSSDHGEELADHDPALFHNNHGHSQYQELVHVPLVLRLPRGARAGTRVASVVRTIDVFPTVLDVAGLPPVGGIEGTSLRSTWESSETVGRVALAEAAAFGSEKKAVRKGPFKYIVTIDAATTARGRNYLPPQYLSRELYDLDRDPAERRNLLAGAAHGSMEAVAGELDRELRERVARRLGRTDLASIDDTTVEKLKALGYVQ